MSGPHEADWRLGPIGFGYDEWNGVFFPPGLRAEDRLGYVSSQYSMVEIDSTFYAHPGSARLRNWSRQVGSDFRFALKIDQRVTHKIENDSLSVQLFRQILLDMEVMGAERVHPFLQFPPGFSADRLGYLESLIVASGPWVKNLVVELRHPSWKPELLKGLGVVVASCDLAGYGEAGHLPRDGEFVPWPPVDEGEFVYLRFSGRHGQYEHDNQEVCNATGRIQWWLDQLSPLMRPGRLVLAPVGNSFAGHAPATLDRLRGLVGLPKPGAWQPGLFD